MEGTLNNSMSSVEKAVSNAINVKMSLESEKQQMMEEFNIQRAKMKELYLQKEEEVKCLNSEKEEFQLELEKLRDQVGQLEILRNNQQSEIKSLLYLIDEAQKECKRLHYEREETHKAYQELQEKYMKQASSSQDISLAPSVLVQAVTKSIARKLGADSDGQENLEEDMKKAQEDAEMLKSLVVPLEDEIKMLKEKISSMQSRKQGSNEGEMRCHMCANYEEQLVTEQTKLCKAEVRARNAEGALKLAQQELELCKAIQTDTLGKWSEERKACEGSRRDMKQRVELAEKKLNEAVGLAANAHKKALSEVTSLTVERQTLQQEIDQVNQQNKELLGYFLSTAEEEQGEDINLPDNVAELQEYCLRLREKMILAMVSREQAITCERSISDQLQEYQDEAQRARKLAEDLNKTRKKMEILLAEREQMRTMSEKLNTTMHQLELANREKDQLQHEINDLRKNLNNSEDVQKDLVVLNKNLQMDLERIRMSDTEVRWQYDEDVNECNGCKQPLLPKQKFHCRHCGRIFCMKCIDMQVLVGPRRVPTKVCSVCHTLLQPHAPPYFSTRPLLTDNN